MMLIKFCCTAQHFMIQYKKLTLEGGKIPMNNKEIGKRIKDARESKKMSKAELASIIKVAPSTIARYEDGEFKKMKMPIIESIANALDVNPMWIIGKSETKERNIAQEYKLEDVYFSFAKEMQEKKVSKENMEKMWKFYEMIKNM